MSLLRVEQEGPRFDETSLVARENGVLPSPCRDRMKCTSREVAVGPGTRIKPRRGAVSASRRRGRRTPAAIEAEA